MFDVNNPITIVPKVGPKYKYLLSKLDIETVGDLLYHFPFRYDDFSKVKNIAEITTDEQTTIKAKIKKIDNIFTRYGKKLTKARVYDATGELDTVWFNQTYLKATLLLDQNYYFSGKIIVETKKAKNQVGFFEAQHGTQQMVVDKQRLKRLMYNPEFELEKEQMLNTARLVPIYPETAGVSSKWLRLRINDVINASTRLVNTVDFLPPETLTKHKLLNIDTALKQIHFPVSLENAQNARERFAFEELFLELLNVELRKKDWHENYKGHTVDYKRHQKALDVFIKTLPFELTPSQQIALAEILEEMTKPTPMNRLLEGDVGTGKTIVAVIASYICYLNGLKVIYMAPTEILAKQLFDTFTKYLAPVKTQISLVTSSAKNKNDVDSNITIGTHALLFETLATNNLGMVIVDEQHRFGVEQRTKLLRQSQHKPHFLAMTATPIPRTLALTLYGDLTLSSLKTPPNKDKKVITKVIQNTQREKVYEWVRKKVELEKEQVFIVCPLIEQSEAESLENVKAAEKEFKVLSDGAFKGLKIAMLHGRLKPKEKAEIMEHFKTGKTQILVSTPVIEVGIDIPNANIILIESAERYGLASLHQLRGRVGRGNKEGFCFVFMSNPTQNSYARLKHLEKVNNGLELAEIDLKNRGYGDLYGTMQSGFKRLRVANLSDVTLLEKAKAEAQGIIHRLAEFPLLKNRLEKLSGKFVGNN